MPSAIHSTKLPVMHLAASASPPPPSLSAANDQSFPALRALWRDVKHTRGYHIAPVRTAEHHNVASSLVRRRYAWRGYNTETLSHRPDDGHRLTLAAWQYDELVATLTLAGDSPGGLPTETLYAREIARLRRSGRVLCEVSRLAVDPDFSCPELLRSLFAAAFAYGQSRFAASDVVIGVNPRHAAYYQRRMGFRQIGAHQHHPHVDAPVVLLHQTLSELATAQAIPAIPA